MTCEATYGYDFARSLCTVHNRGIDDNAVGFSTTKLDMTEANALGMFCERLYKAGVERGRLELASRVRNILPPEQL